jgi:hypothetical protein
MTILKLAFAILFLFPLHRFSARCGGAAGADIVTAGMALLLVLVIAGPKRAPREAASLAGE